MYERDMDVEEASARGVDWYSNKDFTSVDILHQADKPVESHINSTEEMESFSTTKEDKHFENSVAKNV